MKLRRLYVSQFKQFVEPFEINGLHNGLVVITGANEAGKSTLSLALRSAFFERHNNSTVEAFRPYGDSSARPEVHVEFELQQQQAVLEKRFLRQARCDLQIGGERYDGTQAETYLAERLGFNLRRRGSSTLEDWGVPGLLWVQQGELHHLQDAVEAATHQLGEALGASMGRLVSSDSDAVLTEVERRLAELVTATGKPRADYLKCLTDEARLTEQLAALSKETERYQSLVDQLDQLFQQFKSEQKQEVWTTLRAQIPALQAELDQALQHQNVLAQLATQLQSLEQEQSYIKQALQSIEADQSRYAELKQRAAQLKASTQAAERRFEQALSEKNQAQRHHQQAKKQLDERVLHAQWLAQQREREQLTQRHSELKQSLSQVKKQEHAERELRAALPQHPITLQVLDELLALERRCALLAAQRDMVSTSLRFDVHTTEGIQVAGKPLPSMTDTLHISEATTVLIAGVGAIQVTPGGQDLATLHQTLQAEQERYQALLKQHGVNHLAQAQHAYREYEQQQLELQRIQSELSRYAPEGSAALSRAVAELEQAIAALSKTAIPEPSDSGLTVTEAQEHEREADRSWQRAARWFEEAQQQKLTLHVELTGVENEIQRLEQHLQDEQQQRLVAHHRARLEETKVALKAITEEQASLVAAQQNYRSTATIESEIKSLERRAEQAHHAFNDLRLSLSKVETEVRIVGAKGLEEQLLTLQATLAHTSRRVQYFSERVETLSYLKNQLTAERARVREQLQAPLVERMQHYLAFLFPNARIELTENFVPRLLHRQGTPTAALTDLSFGALEQMAIISRLAYADLLKEAGRPTLIVLDDVLAYSDTQRLDRMKVVIDDAASRHQIILFSCNPSMWSDAGGQVINVEQLKLAASLSA